MYQFPPPGAPEYQTGPLEHVFAFVLIFFLCLCLVLLALPRRWMRRVLEIAFPILYREDK